MKKLIFLLLVTLSCSTSNNNDERSNHFKSDNNKSGLSPHTVAMAMVGGAHIHITTLLQVYRIIFGGLLAFNHS